jgi:hypothetical protein
MSERPTCDQATDRCDKFGCFASFARRVWGCESVGREEVMNVHLCPEEPCVNVLHIVQGDEIQGAIQRMRGFQIAAVGPRPRASWGLLTLGYRPLRR